MRLLAPTSRHMLPCHPPALLLLTHQAIAPPKLHAPSTLTANQLHAVVDAAALCVVCTPLQVLPVVQELCSANASVGGRPVVILAHKSKQAMEEELAKHLVHKKGTTIICRRAPRPLSLSLQQRLALLHAFVGFCGHNKFCESLEPSGYFSQTEVNLCSAF